MKHIGKPGKMNCPKQILGQCLVPGFLPVPNLALSNHSVSCFGFQGQGNQIL